MGRNLNKIIGLSEGTQHDNKSVEHRYVEFLMYK